MTDPIKPPRLIDIKDYASFDDAVTTLRKAMNADKAMFWFDGCSDNERAIEVRALANFGSGTAGADEANLYLKRAVELLSPKIVEMAKELAQVDKNSGFILLGRM